MISEIEEYFEQTFPRYFSNKLEDLYQNRGTLERGFSHHFINFQRQMDELYREHIPKTEYLAVVKEKVCQFYSFRFQTSETYEKTQLEIRICLLIFCLWLEQTFKEYKMEAFEIVKVKDFEKTLNSFKLVCQFYSEWSFESFLQQLFLELKQRQMQIRKRIIQLFQQCGIQSAGYLFNLKQTPQKCVKVKKEYIPQSQNKRVTPAQVIIKKEVIQIQETTVKIKRQEFSPKNSGKSETNLTNSSWMKTNCPSIPSKGISPSGRTIFMSHPMKYIKKNRNVKKVYHYVENSIEIL